MLNIVIIGYGYSGKRFYDVLKVRQQKKNDVNVVGICDKNENNLKALNNIFICTNVSSLFCACSDIDIVIVAVNEKYRYDVFEELSEYKGKFKIIISEKLLTEDLWQAQQLLKMYEENEIFVHFVERFSPVVLKLYHWITENDLIVKRANFFWGKNRLYDKRPTIGVISEISHPLDMILYLANVNYDKNICIENGNYVFSDYSSFNVDVLETINVSLRTSENVFIYGNSSFLWDKRDRRIMLFLSQKENNNIQYIANLTFDNPSWDNDKCEILRINDKEKTKEIVETYIAESTNNELKGLNKIYKFVDDIIKGLDKGEYNQKLPNLKSSVCIQKIVNDILNKAKENGYHFSISN